MNRPRHEVAEIINRFGESFIRKHQPNSYQLRVLNALALCQTSALGGHKYQCDHCGNVHIGYNSCRNRHCPKCQGSNQTLWVEDRINNAYAVQHYHVVFTVPEALNAICLIDSKWFYNKLFDSVWQTLRTFGYTQYGVEGGAICVLHTWGQNLSLHPHIHCLVPAWLLKLEMLSCIFFSSILNSLSISIFQYDKILQKHQKKERIWK